MVPITSFRAHSTEPYLLANPSGWGRRGWNTSLWQSYRFIPSDSSGALSAKWNNRLFQPRGCRKNYWHSGWMVSCKPWGWQNGICQLRICTHWWGRGSAWVDSHRLFHRLQRQCPPICIYLCRRSRHAQPWAILYRDWQRTKRLVSGAAFQRRKGLCKRPVCFLHEACCSSSHNPHRLFHRL